MGGGGWGGGAAPYSYSKRNLDVTASMASTGAGPNAQHVTDPGSTWTQQSPSGTRSVSGNHTKG